VRKPNKKGVMPDHLIEILAILVFIGLIFLFIWQLGGKFKP
jgi:hypothetical protein